MSAVDLFCKTPTLQSLLKLSNSWKAPLLSFIRCLLCKTQALKACNKSLDLNPIHAVIWPTPKITLMHGWFKPLLVLIKSDLKSTRIRVSSESIPCPLKLHPLTTLMILKRKQSKYLSMLCALVLISYLRRRLLLQFGSQLSMMIQRRGFYRLTVRALNHTMS